MPSDSGASVVAVRRPRVASCLLPSSSCSLSGCSWVRLCCPAATAGPRGPIAWSTCRPLSNKRGTRAAIRRWACPPSGGRLSRVPVRVIQVVLFKIKKSLIRNDSSKCVGQTIFNNEYYQQQNYGYRSSILRKSIRKFRNTKHTLELNQVQSKIHLNFSPKLSESYIMQL